MFRTITLRILALSLGLSTLFTAASLAQASAPARPGASTDTPSSAAPLPTKIGIVNIQEAIYASNEGRKEVNALQQKFSPKQAELKNLNDEVESLKKTFQAQSDKLSDEERTKKADEIARKQKTLQRNYDDAQSEYQQAQQELLNRIGGKMMKVLEKYATAKGYTVVLDVSTQQSPVLWASPGTIITKQLVDAYNAANPATAPAAKPAGSAARRPSAPRPKTTPKKR